MLTIKERDTRLVQEFSHSRELMARKKEDDLGFRALQKGT